VRHFAYSQQAHFGQNVGGNGISGLAKLAARRVLQEKRQRSKQDL
jgi:hypothetical protein